jgi:pimeloyl-ACP methyl ester carboxylesterase
MILDRPMYCRMACHMVALSICTLSFDPSAKAASLANGNWVVEERCGEFKAAKDPAAQKGFNWQIDIVVENGRVTASKHSVNPTNSAVTDVTYQGSIKGSDIVIAGTGKRSNLDTTWAYAYSGKIAPDGRAKLTGSMSMKFGNSQKPTPIRECSLTFLAHSDGQSVTPASARSIEDLLKVRNGMIANFSADCRKQLAAGKPKDAVAQATDIRACVVVKLGVAAQSAAIGPPKADQELKLDEYVPGLIKPNGGPAKAKGIIYFVAGYGAPNNLNEFHFPPYVLKRLSDNGWDLIAARIPNRETDLGSEAAAYQVPSGAAFVVRRLRELKAEGYKRIVLAGFSWGGWTALVAAQAVDFPADALFIDSPNPFGKRVGADGNANPFFELNVIAFVPVVNKIETPTILAFPRDPAGNAEASSRGAFAEPNPAVRGILAETHFAETHKANLIIAAPPGFFGHYADWLPFFDYAYGECIAAFLDKPTTEPCRLPAIANTDFRSILSLKQIPNAESRRIASSAPLVGRKFAAYVLNDEDFKRYDFISARERVTLQSQRKFREPIEFHDGQICASQQCRTLIQWSETELLEFESETGKLKAWWIATQ